MPSPELLDLISKSRTTIEKLMCSSDRLKLTKLSDYVTTTVTVWLLDQDLGSWSGCMGFQLVMISHIP